MDDIPGGVKQWEDKSRLRGVMEVVRSVAQVLTIFLCCKLITWCHTTDWQQQTTHATKATIKWLCDICWTVHNFSNEKGILQETTARSKKQWISKQMWINAVSTHMFTQVKDPQRAHTFKHVGLHLQMSKKECNCRHLTEKFEQLYYSQDNENVNKVYRHIIFWLSSRKCNWGNQLSYSTKATNA
jgi:hypothetical protein